MTFRKNEPRCDEPSEMTEAEQRLFIMTKLSNPWWRLNHLYKIQNEKGELVTFRMRPRSASCSGACTIKILS